MDGRAAGHNFERGPSKFGLNWLSVFSTRVKLIKYLKIFFRTINQAIFGVEH
jgi:hypothetical protein